MSNIFETKIDLDTPFGYLEAVPAVFDVDVELYPAEPFSHGGSRGTEREVTANLKSLLGLDPHSAIQAFGHQAIARAEQHIQETYP